MTMATPAILPDERSSRLLLLVSLALNLFFVGATGALVVRHYFADHTEAAAPLDRSVAARIERLAATLPPPDADILRGEYRANAAAVDAARDGYRGTQDDVRAILRAAPFHADAMRAAMGKTRVARQAFDELLQEVIASAAARMSPAGRNRLADWPPPQRGSSSGESSRR